jgi:hypothetical protein
MQREELPIRFPCPDKNKQLAATPGTLYCATCDRDVIELEYLTAREVRALKKRADEGERICVHYKVDEDGLIQLKRSPPMRPMRAMAAAAGIAMALTGGAAIADATVPSAQKVPCAKGKGNGSATVATAQVTPQTPGKAQPLKPARPAPKPVYDMVDGGI